MPRHHKSELLLYLIALNNHILKVHHSREYDLPCHIHIRTLLSTDSGVAFLLRCPEGTFYHAGDLNDWITDDMPEAERRQMTGSFRAALRPLKGIPIDHACLPLDPHLGSHYADGFLYFLKQTGTKKVYPMHSWGDMGYIHCIERAAGYFYDFKFEFWSCCHTSGNQWI